MYLESIKITNFRKFRENNNTVSFVKSQEIVAQKVDSESVQKPSLIAPSTTLVVGKNNSGKTTFAHALKLLSGSGQPKASDFNLDYINELLEKYKSGQFDSFPTIKFELTVQVDQNDLIASLNDIVLVNADKENEEEHAKTATLRAQYRLSETEKFRAAVESLLTHAKENEIVDNTLASMFYDLLNMESPFAKSEDESHWFVLEVLNAKGRVVKNFSLKSLISIKEIKANRNLEEGVLRSIFNKIVRFQFDNDADAKNGLEQVLSGINETLTGRIREKRNNVSTVLGEIENNNHVDLDLKGDVSYQSIVNSLIKYSFSDNGKFIPEDQFGLGYINLLNIVGEIIHYVDSYEKDSHNSQINMLIIEEPEAFMHPQMQEFFIKRIDNAVSKALELVSRDSPKRLHCQIVITTHSSHIVNSKIQSSNSFNSINYFFDENSSTHVVCLNDGVVSGEDAEKENALKFIKKHIKYKVSELFFSDAVVFVEGATEEALLQFYIERHDVLKDYYVAVFNINGAHGKTYYPLIKALRIPCLIITDLDIKRDECEKGKKHDESDEDCSVCGHKKGNSTNTSLFAQIKRLEGRKSTNTTLKGYLKKSTNLEGTNEEPSFDLSDLQIVEQGNSKLVTQNAPIEGYFATSLEESIILTNYDNAVVHCALQECLPRKCKGLDSKSKDELIEEVRDKSYQLQRSLSGKKTSFTSFLLYYCLLNDADIPRLPMYVHEGFGWLAKKLEGVEDLADVSGDQK